MSHVTSQINAGISTLLQMQKNQERATGKLNPKAKTLLLQMQKNQERATGMPN